MAAGIVFAHLTPSGLEHFRHGGNVQDRLLVDASDRRDIEDPGRSHRGASLVSASMIRRRSLPQGVLWLKVQRYCNTVRGQEQWYSS